MAKFDIWFERPENLINIELTEAQEKAWKEFQDAESEDDADDAYQYFIELMLVRFKRHILETVGIEVIQH